MPRAFTIVFCCVSVIGCADSGPEPVPAELAPFQGYWYFDEPRFLEEHRTRAKSAEEFARFRKLYDEAKARGAGVAARLVVSGTTLADEGGTIEGRYDILEHRAEGKTLVCKAMYHEDRHDPGDANVIGPVLEVSPSPSGEILILRQGKGEQPTFYKRVR